MPRVDAIYGFYHGQDPRTFEPDAECCTPRELSAHREACLAADRGQWAGDDSGCQVTPEMIVCRSSFGLGTYYVVVDDDGEFVRDATYRDLKGSDAED